MQFMKDNPDKLKKHGIGYWAAQIARKYDGVEGGELVYMITGQKRRKFGQDGGPAHHPLDAIRHMGLSRHNRGKVWGVYSGVANSKLILFYDSGICQGQI